MKHANVNFGQVVYDISKYSAYLVYHIYKHLCVIDGEATEYFILVFTRKDVFDQGGELVRGERASD